MSLTSSDNSILSSFVLHTKLQELYVQKVVDLSESTRLFVFSIKGSQTQSKYFFKRLLAFDPYSYVRNPTIRAETLIETCCFIADLRKSLDGGEPNPNIKSFITYYLKDNNSLFVRLDSSIAEILNSLSSRPQRALLRQYAACNRNVEEYYSLLKTKLSSSFLFDGIGKASMPEARNAIVKIVNLVERELEKDSSTNELCSQNDTVKSVSLADSIDSLSFDQHLQISLPKEIEYLAPYFIASVDSFPTRTKSIIMNLFEQCDSSIAFLYQEILSPSFSITQLPGCGQKSAQVIASFLSSFVSEVEDLVSNHDISDYKTIAIGKMIFAMIHSESASQDIALFAESYGYFPFFKTINSLIDTFSDEVQFIFQASTHIYHGAEIRSLRSLYPERGRRDMELIVLRNEHFRRIRSCLGLLQRAISEQCHYQVMSPSLAIEINEKEGTNFSMPFINWAISVLFSDYILVGDTEKALTSYFKKPSALSLFPSHLRRFINLDKFISFVDHTATIERMDDVTLSIKEIIHRFLHDKRGDITNDVEAEITSWCTYLLVNHFHLEVKGDDVIFRHNRVKSLSVIAYEILKDNGHSMTAEQLVKAVQAAYPDRQFQPKSIIQAVRLHNEVATIGRSSTYTLKEWQTGEDRGGTIRLFVSEYLSSLPVPIASLTDVETYVKQFRPETNERSIQYNLQQDTANTFRIYVYKGKRYVGYSYRSYTPRFVPLEKTITSHRPNKESQELLVQFINKHSRFPSGFKSASEEERRLARFYYVQKSNYKNGKMTDKEKEDWDLFEERYRMYHIRPKRRKRKRKKTS